MPFKWNWFIEFRHRKKNVFLLKNTAEVAKHDEKKNSIDKLFPVPASGKLIVHGYYSTYRWCHLWHEILNPINSRDSFTVANWLSCVTAKKTHESCKFFRSYSRRRTHLRSHITFANDWSLHATQKKNKINLQRAHNQCHAWYWFTCL